MMTPIRHVALLVVLLAGSTAASAQAPFSRAAVEVGGVMPLDRTAFWDGWETSGGVSVAVGVPFYLGEVRAVVQALSYEAVGEDVTDFDGRHVFVEWTAPVPVLPRVALHGGGRIGVFQMAFEEGTGRLQHEQEVAAFAVVGLSYRLGAWALHMRSAYGAVLLSDVERQAFISFSLRRSFALPDWLQEVLR